MADTPPAVLIVDPSKPEPAPGRWQDTVCDCCADCAICCCGCFCYPTMAGQLYERVARAGSLERVPGATCVSIAALIWLLVVVGDGAVHQ